MSKTNRSASELYVAATIADGKATVLSVHRMGHLARASAERAAGRCKGSSVQFAALAVNMLRTDSVRPQVGDVLMIVTVDGEHQALADVAVTDEQIEALRKEALAAGDSVQVYLCEVALRFGSGIEREACAATIRQAAAMVD